MSRPADSPWAIAVAQVAMRPGNSADIDQDFPAPSGIGDDIIGVRENEPIHVRGTIDSLVDGLMMNAELSVPIHTECTRCLTPLRRVWTAQATALFPYRDDPRLARQERNGERDIIAGEDEAEDVYPMSADGAFVDIEALIRDVLVESLPLQPVCDEGCLGLCPQCGVNLNDEPDHHHDTTDIRFAQLAALKAQLEAEQQ